VFSHCDLAIYIKKINLKAKEELQKTPKYFTMQKYNLKKKPSKKKKTKILQDTITQ
jgi:hypothetical protein